jgi:thioredoxin-like negative regulator of GroEL
LLARAREAFRAGDIEVALPLFQAVADSPNASTAEYLELADALWSDFRFEQAFTVLRGAAEREPANPAPLLLAAKRSFSVGRFMDAAGFLREALKRNPTDGTILRMLAEVLERQGRPAEAEAVARQVVDQHPDDARAVRALAHVLRNLGRVDEAAQLLQRHITDHCGPESWRIQYELAACLDRLGDYQGAMATLMAAKAQLQPTAQPLLRQWQSRGQRREEFPRSLDAATFERWRGVSEPQRVAILAGHPRSGTTLLEQMLAAHSWVLTTDETGVLRNQFVEPIVLNAASTADAVREVDQFDQEQVESGRAFYFRATEAHLGQPIGDRFLIEKDPLATCDLGFMLRLLPEAAVIFPLRDPRDVCVSYFFTLVPLNVDSAPSLDLASTCAAAACSLRLWQHWRKIIPQSWVEVRYEQLVQQPRTELARVVDAVGLPWEDRMLALPERQGDRGVRTPTYSDVAKPLYTHAIGRWRNYAEWLEPHLGPLQGLLEDFGYEG